MNIYEEEPLSSRRLHVMMMLQEWHRPDKVSLTLNLTMKRLLGLRQGSNDCDSYDSKQPEPAPVGDRHEAQADESPLAGDSPRPQANRW